MHPLTTPYFLKGLQLTFRLRFLDPITSLHKRLKSRFKQKEETPSGAINSWDIKSGCRYLTKCLPNFLGTRYTFSSRDEVLASPSMQRCSHMPLPAHPDLKCLIQAENLNSEHFYRISLSIKKLRCQNWVYPCFKFSYYCFTKGKKKKNDIYEIQLCIL